MMHHHIYNIWLNRHLAHFHYMCASRQCQSQPKAVDVFDIFGCGLLAHLTLATAGCPVLALIVGNNLNIFVIVTCC